MSDKRTLTPKEETFEALKTLMFYHNVYVEIRMISLSSFSDKVILTKDIAKNIIESENIAEIKLSFKPEY